MGRARGRQGEAGARETRGRGAAETALTALGGPCCLLVALSRRRSCAGSGGARKPTAALSCLARGRGRAPPAGRGLGARLARRAAGHGARPRGVPPEVPRRPALPPGRGAPLVDRARSRATSTSPRSAPAGSARPPARARSATSPAPSRAPRSAARGTPSKRSSCSCRSQSKLIDRWARALYNQEVVDSAVEAQRYDRALAAHARVAPRGRPRRAGHRPRAHRGEPRARTRPPSSSPLLDERSLAATPAAEEDTEMRKLVAQRLAVVARADKDAELAQHLLQTAGRAARRAGRRGGPARRRRQPGARRGAHRRARSSRCAATGRGGAAPTSPTASPSGSGCRAPPRTS